MSNEIKEAFIVGNGESIKDFNYDFFKDKKTVGTGKLKNDWYPDFYVCVNLETLKSNLESIKNIQDDADDNNQSIAEFYQDNRDKAEEDREEAERQDKAEKEEKASGGDSSKGSGSVQGKDYGMNKGGIIKKRKKKK